MTEVGNNEVMEVVAEPVAEAVEKAVKASKDLNLHWAEGIAIVGGSFALGFLTRVGWDAFKAGKFDKLLGRKKTAAEKVEEAIDKTADKLKETVENIAEN